jgi:predicted GIY-YIG superfamily endonuclease
VTYYVYLIECKTPEHYYIGLTQHLEYRLKQHAKGRGAQFTKHNGFKKVLRVIKCRNLEHAKFVEKNLTRAYRKQHGTQNVSGYCYFREHMQNYLVARAIRLKTIRQLTTR